MVIKHFKEPVFKTFLTFITDAEPKEVEAYIKKRFPKEPEFSLHCFEGMCFACESHEIKHYIVWLRWSEKCYYILTHEITHLVEWRFKDIGMKFEGEQVAYYHEYWVKKLWKEMSNRKPKRKK